MGTWRGWCLTINNDRRLRLLMVAETALAEAERLALEYTGGGVVSTQSRLSQEDIQAFKMAAGEVKKCGQPLVS